MKNKTIIIVIFLLAIFTVACSQETSSLSKQENKASVGQKPSISSDFVKDKVFKGGSESTNYTLKGLRKRPNSTAIRIHMNFGIVGDATPEGEPPVLAEKLPLYEISYSDKKVKAIFTGAKWDVSEDKVQNLKELVPIIQDLDVQTFEGKLHVIFTLKEPVSLKVLDSEQPAGISILMKPDGEKN